MLMGTTTFTKKTLGLESSEPALTPPSSVPETSFLKKPKIGGGKSKKREIPEGLWTKCQVRATMVFDKELDENLKVCTHCQYHFPIGARERTQLAGRDLHVRGDGCRNVQRGRAQFHRRGSLTPPNWRITRKSTGLKDAVVTGHRQDRRHRCGLGGDGFQFLGGSMGSVVGEKLTRLIENATEKGLPVIIISTSGGARMYEGMFSLMQMAKTCGALAYHAKADCPISACSPIPPPQASWPATPAWAILSSPNQEP